MATRRHILLMQAAAFSLSSLCMGCGLGLVNPNLKASLPLNSSSGTQVKLSNYIWTAPVVGSENSLGTIQYSYDGETVQLLSPTIWSAEGPFQCATVSSGASSVGATITESFSRGDTILQVNLSLQVSGGNLTVDLQGNQGIVSLVDLGPWNSGLSRQAIAVPYYSNAVYFLPNQHLYANTWWDWHSSSAASKNGNALSYKPRTDGTRNPLHEEFSVAVSSDLQSVFPTIANAPSPYLQTLAGRLVIDVWGSPQFSSIQKDLQYLGMYGIKDCVGIVHNWQNQGYDNGLPGQYPANTSLGGDDGLRHVIAAGKMRNCIMAVHQNYIDYYPNFRNYTPKSLALGSTGQQVPTWLNSEGIQAYQAKPSWMVSNAGTESPEIHTRYGTGAAFLDVNSSIDPWLRGDMDTDVDGAGTSYLWFSNAASLWKFERDTEQGPVFGEGDEHWYYSGLLDGVEAQMGAGGKVPQNLGEKLPLFVDFDLLRIHPLQVNHGMGYYVRWTPGATASMSTTQQDAYRMQEVAFGHAPYIETPYWNNIPHVLLEQNLVTPVAANYGTATASSIRYQVNGEWVDTNAAAKANAFTRVEVGYSSGLTVAANAQSEPLVWDGLTLPQYGWAATSPTVLAYTALCGAALCDYAETAVSVYANARNASDFITGEGYAAPSISSLRQTVAATFSIQYSWSCYKTIHGNYVPFVHFVDDSELAVNAGTVLQEDHALTEPTSGWTPGTTIVDGPFQVSVPPSVHDGQYSIRMGLWDPLTGERLSLVGNNDGNQRYIVGYLLIENGGMKISLLPPPAQPIDTRLNYAGNVVAFPAVQTDGMVSISREKGNWVLRPFPATRDIIVLLSSAKFPPPSIVQSSANPMEVRPIYKAGFWQLPMNGGTQYLWPVTP